jgi:hypothetical protein
LDGLAIEQKEQFAAKEAYLGKLTNELLAEKVGHFSFHNILSTALCTVVHQKILLVLNFRAVTYIRA